MKGFTLIELLIVAMLTLLIAALMFPVGLNFYQGQVLDETTSDILNTLRRAQSQASFQKNDSAFGVRFSSTSYTLFQGSSYSARTQSEDEDFSLSGVIFTSGLSEIVFAKRTGIPSATGTITVSYGSDSEGILVKGRGIVERN
jgi:prepilin-type N-terminal cleavage/methylation domain-containing protein